MNNYQVILYNTMGEAYVVQTFPGNTAFDAVAATLAYLVSIGADPTFATQVATTLIT